MCLSESYLPKRAKKTGIHPTVASMGGKSKPDQWIFPESNPGKSGKKKLVAAALRIIIEVIFSTHLRIVNLQG